VRWDVDQQNVWPQKGHGPFAAKGSPGSAANRLETSVACWSSTTPWIPGGAFPRLCLERTSQGGPTSSSGLASVSFWSTRNSTGAVIQRLSNHGCGTSPTNAGPRPKSLPRTLDDRIRLLTALEDAGELTLAEASCVFRETWPMRGVASLTLQRFVSIELDEAPIGPETRIRRWRR
jgi:hypothetical protein